MSQRVMMLGLLVISAVATFATDANAQFFDGFAFFGFSKITAKIESEKSSRPRYKAFVRNHQGQTEFY